MGEPAYKLPEEEGDARSAMRPDLPGLRALEDGGEGDGVPSGDLPSVEDESGANTQTSSDGAAPTDSKDSQPSLYNNNDAGGRRSKLKNRLGKLAKNKLFVGGLISGSSVIVALIVLAVLVAGSLKIPNLSAHIVGWQFARISRQIAKNSRVVASEQVGVSTLKDSAWKSVTEKYSTVRGKTYGPMVDKINSYRPGKVYQNLQSNGKINFETEPRHTFLDGKIKYGTKTTALILDGNRIPVNSSTWNKLVHPISGFNGSVEFSGALNSSLENTLPSTNFIVRGVVARKLAQSLGLRYQWYNPKIYAAKSEADARLILEEQSAKQLAADEKPTDSIVKKVKNASEEAQAAKETCVADPACGAELVAGGGTTSAIEGGIAKSLTTSVAEKVLSFLSPLSVLVPLCIIYDGSLDTTNAQALIDSKSSIAMKSFMAVSSAADQQKAGAVNGEAVGAMNWKVGSIETSNAEIRANGKTPDTHTSDQPQASATGEYTSIADTLPGPLATFINAVAGPFCPKLSDPLFNAGAAILSLGAAGATGGFSGGVEASGLTALRLYVTNLVKTVFSKRALTVAAGQTVATVGLTLLAQNIVHNKNAAIDTALSTEDTFNNASDAGGNLYANQIARQHYARPLTCSEVAQLRTADQNYQTAQANEKNSFERYVAFSNPDSLVSRLGTTASASASSGIVASVLQSAAKLFNPLAAILGFGGFLRPHTAFAADCSSVLDYGIVQWGMGPDEEAAVDHNPTYKPLENQRIFSERDYCSMWSSTGCLARSYLNDQNFLGQYNACFGYDASDQIDPTTSMGWMLARQLGDKLSPVLARTKSGDIKNTGPNIEAAVDTQQYKGQTVTVITGINVHTDKAFCSPADIGINNSYVIPGPGNGPIGDFIFRYRLEKNYELTLDQLLNVQNSKAETAVKT